MKDLERIQKVWYRIPKWWRTKIMELVEVSLKKEIWKPVKYWEEKYKVSNLGRICNIEAKRIINTAEICGFGQKRKSGIKRSRGGTIKVHQVVLEAFVSPRPEGMVCRHLDGNSLNNNLFNLKWGTPTENMQDMVKHGRSRKGNKK